MSRSSPPPGQPAPPREPKKGIEVGLVPLIASIVGLLLAVVVIGGAVWFTRDGADEPAATKTAATQPDGAVLTPPTIEVASDGRDFTYTLDHDGYREGDVLQIQTGRGEDSLDDFDAVPLPAGETQHTSKVGEDQRECGRARLVRNDQYSAWSEPTCDKAEEE